MRPRIQYVEIENILGTAHAEFPPGSLTLFTGQNGSGKTSLIEAFVSIFEGGHDPGLLRTGAGKGVIRFTLNTGAEITKTVTPTRTEVLIIGPDGKPVPAPQTWIRRLADSLAVEPARLLTAKPRDLMTVLLQVMPISFDPAEISAQLPEPVRNYASIPMKPATLEQLAAVRAEIFESRTVVNRAAKEAEATVSSLRQSLSPDDATDWAAKARELEVELAATNKAREGAGRETADAFHQAEHAIVDHFAAEIKALEDQRAARIAELQAERDKSMAEIEAEARPILDKLTGHIADARVRAEAQARAAGVRESVGRFAAMAREKNTVAEQLTEALANLDALRRTRLASLPIPGFEFPGGGQVLLDGVPWERTNLARRIEIVFQIWDLWDPPFGVLDDAEHFDPEMWEAFKAYCLQTNRQVFAARVSDGPLTIQTIDDGEVVTHVPAAAETRAT